MALVIAEHAFHLVSRSATTSLLSTAVYTTTRLAPVAFVAISGLVLGYFLFSGRAPGEVTARFQRRALFLLVCAHPAIQLARLFNVDTPGLAPGEELVRRLLYDVPITHTIAVCLLVAPFFLRRLSAARTALLAVALLVVTLPLRILWEPTTAAGRGLEQLLLGTPAAGGTLEVGWPLVPWLGIFLLGSVAGRRIGDVRQLRTTLPVLVGQLLRTAIALAVAGAALLAGYKLLRVVLTGRLSEETFRILYPSSTTGMLALYLCALALLLAALLWRLDGQGANGRVVWALSVFGRTSLFTYVTQFVFVHSIPAYLGYRGQLDLGGVAGLAVLATAATWGLAYAYGRWRGWIEAGEYREVVAQHRLPTAPAPT